MSSEVRSEAADRSSLGPLSGELKQVIKRLVMGRLRPHYSTRSREIGGQIGGQAAMAYAIPRCSLSQGPVRIAEAIAAHI